MLLTSLLNVGDLSANDVFSDPALAMEVLAEPLPSLHLVTESGATLSSAAWQRKLVLLHFWATWCKPCREELPALAALARKLDPARAEVVLVAVDDDKSARDPTRYARDLGVELPIYIAKLSEIPAEFWTWGVPSTYIVEGSTRKMGRCLGPRAWRRLTNSLSAVLR